VKEEKNKLFVRKVINSKFKDNCTYNLVLETFLNNYVLTANIEKQDEVIWSKKDTQIPYLMEEKHNRRNKLIDAAQEKFEEI